MDDNTMIIIFHLFGYSLNSFFHSIITIKSDPKVIQIFAIRAIGNATAKIRKIITVIFHFCRRSLNFIWPPIFDSVFILSNIPHI